MSSAGPLVKRRDWFALSAFWLSFLLMVWPTEADIMVSLAIAKRLDVALIVASTCLLIVLFPWIASLRRHRREPGIWGGKGFLIATGVILVLNVLMVGVVVGTILVK